MKILYSTDSREGVKHDDTKTSISIKTLHSPVRQQGNDIGTEMASTTSSASLFVADVAETARSVTWDGAKSESSKIFLLKGTIPVQAKPAIIFAGVIDSGQAWRTIIGV